MKLDLNTKTINKEKLLRETYKQVLEVGFSDGSLDSLPQLFKEDIMGIGSAADEIYFSIKEISELILNQRKQSKSFDDYYIKSNPVFVKILEDGATALVIDMAELTAVVNGRENKLSPRMTMVFEFVNDSWRVIHWHASISEHISEGEDPWHVEEWKKKTEKLEKMVKEKTSELIEKNRELEIEAALERVRAKAMAMNSSEDLTDTADTFFSELVKLNIRPHRCGFGIVDKDTRIADIHATSATEDNSLKIVTGQLKLYGHPVLDKIFEGYIKQKEYHPVLKGKEILEYYEVMNPQIEFPDFADDEVQYGYYFYFKEGGVFAWSDSQYTNDELEIFRRYTSVLSLTYRRYFDLKESEAQSREAHIQLALEKVRMVALRLKKSEEMVEVAKVLYEQLVDLGFSNIRNAIIDIENGDGDTFTDYDYSREMSGTITQMSYHDDPTLEGQFKKMAATTDDFFELKLEGRDLQNLVDMRLKNGEAPDPRLSNVDLLTYNLFSFGNGAIGISNFGLLNAEEKAILDRFRNVFTFAYKRYTDLAMAEAQAREAQIEAALERVRTRSMAMQNSDELRDAATLLYKELRSLGLEKFINCGYVLIDEENNVQNAWMTNIGGTIREVHQMPLTGDEIMDERYEMWKKKVLVFHQKVGGERLKKHNTFVTGHDDAELKSKNMLIDLPDPTVFYFGNFSEGYLHILAEEEFSKESEQLLARFTSVFEITFRRFLDLEKAEKQREIIQAENDRKTEELEEARKLQLAMLPKELPKLSKLDIAVHMQTATEVGGDYYDFSIKDDGSLNVCLGDATGHGLKAGTLVAMMKSLFVNDSVKLDINIFFNSSNNTLKKMSLNKMMMAFAMINIYGDRIKIANAGIPPIYIFREKEKNIEEVILHGLPIGAMKDIKYEVFESKLNSRDVILMMSDGMPELQNAENDMYGYKRIEKVLKDSSSKKSEEIIDELKTECNNWLGEIEPDDDITFVVIKAK